MPGSTKSRVLFLEASVHLVHELPLEHPTSANRFVHVGNFSPVSKSVLFLGTNSEWKLWRMCLQSRLSAEFGFWCFEVSISPFSVAAEVTRLSAEDFSESPWEFLQLVLTKSHG